MTNRFLENHGFYDEGGRVYQPRYLYRCSGPNSKPEGSGVLLRRYEGCIWTKYDPEYSKGYEEYAWEGERVPLKEVGKDWFCNCPDRCSYKDVVMGHDSLCSKCFKKYKLYVKKYNESLPYVDSVKILRELGFNYVF